VIERRAADRVTSADPLGSSWRSHPRQSLSASGGSTVLNFTVDQEPYEHLCVARQGAGGRAMPSSEYFRRQADLCLRLSLVASDKMVSTLLIAMAQNYTAQAEALSQSDLVAVVATDASPARETSEAQDEAR
jgi:hypothetical protein